MPSFRVSVPHNLGQDVARTRVAGFLDMVRRDLPAQVSDVSGEWNDNRLDFRLVASGLGIAGALQVEDALVEASGNLPLAVVFFRGQIERTIRDELAKLLA